MCVRKRFPDLFDVVAAAKQRQQQQQQQVAGQEKEAEELSIIHYWRCTGDVCKYQECDGTPADIFAHASRDGRLYVLQDMLAAGHHIDAVDSEGTPALGYAANEGQLACAQLLIAEGADVNLATPAGLTPIMAACVQENVQVVALLLEHGANVLCKDASGRSVLDYATHNLVDTDEEGDEDEEFGIEQKDIVSMIKVHMEKQSTRI